MNDTRDFGADESGRARVLHTFSDWSSLPASLPEVASPFLCLFVANATGRSAEAIGVVMRELMHRGCHYIVCWGPDCERVHDIWDEEYVYLHLDNLDHAPPGDSTWHSREPLDEALWFAMFVARACRDEEGHRTLLAVCEIQEGWPKRIAEAFADPEGFNSEILARDEPDLWGVITPDRRAAKSRAQSAQLASRVRRTEHLDARQACALTNVITRTGHSALLVIGRRVGCSKPPDQVGREW